MIFTKNKLQNPNISIEKIGVYKNVFNGHSYDQIEKWINENPKSKTIWIYNLEYFLEKIIIDFKDKGYRINEKNKRNKNIILIEKTNKINCFKVYNRFRKNSLDWYIKFITIIICWMNKIFCWLFIIQNIT